jgi:imidazolonepropionase
MMAATGNGALLIKNVQLATMNDEAPYGLIDRAALLMEGGLISWAGPSSGQPRAGRGTRVIDAGGRLATPGLIDCHTHLVYGGSRADEFEMRLKGASYADIARAGGGILSTVRATRAASEKELVAEALPRLDALIDEGVTTVEIKSGYGLDVDTELRMLKSARALARRRPVDVVTTFLGAHALPPEYKEDRAAYLKLVCDEALPSVRKAGLANAVDAFCENIAFTLEETARLFAAARALGLPVKLHAEQLSNMGGAKLAASHGALSCDHLEYLDDDGVIAMARAGTVATLLPGAFYYLKERQTPPVESLRRHGVPMAVATDLNPGSSPVHSLLAAMNMACVLFGLTPEEALRGVTENAARALGLKDRGTIAPRMKADVVLWNVTAPGHLAYPLGYNPCHLVIRNGREVTR